VASYNYVTERIRAKTFKYTFENGDTIDEKTELEDLSEKNKDLPKRKGSGQHLKVHWQA
jgi:hypothetical protein